MTRDMGRGTETVGGSTRPNESARLAKRHPYKVGSEKAEVRSAAEKLALLVSEGAIRSW